MNASRWMGKCALRGFAAVVVVWLIAPVLVVIPLAFAGKRSFVFPPKSYSTQWFSELLDNPDWRDAILTSVKIAVLVVIVSAILGTAAALGMQRTRMRGMTFVRGLLIAPMIVPVVITAVGVYAVFLPRKLIGTDLGFVLAHTALAIPFVVIAVTTSLAGFDRRLENAAASLGAGAWTTFWTVTFPLIRPGLLAGAVFAFIASFDELVVALFLASPFMKTLPVQMYDSLEQIDPTIAAASTVFLLATTGVMLIALVLNRKSSEHGLA